ncbi:MAG: DUF3987 domain-containing protein [Magnetococcales bacterium]|nr:DUF3987 domain-containing protein [Magnetococcales bacterium]
MNNKQFDLPIVSTTWDTLIQPGQTTEVRALKANFSDSTRTGTIGGYFNDKDSLLRELPRIANFEGAYFVLNPVDPAKIDPVNNRLEFVSRATRDDQILRYQWLIIDIDPVRPSGTSATGEELELAQQKGAAINQFLEEKGWPDQIWALSGNGYHMLFRIDQPTDKKALISGCLQSLSLMFSDDKVKVDVSVGNPARICKLYGSEARKGDNSNDRPYRMSKIRGPETPIAIVPEELLQQLASFSSTMVSSAIKEATPGRSSPVFDLIKDRFPDVKGPIQWKNNCSKLVFPTCPWNPDHNDNSAFVVQFENGAVAAGCHHDSCQGKSWIDLRDIVNPGNGWGDPVPLAMGLPAVLPIIPELIPDVLRPWLVDVSERMQVPLDFLAVTFVTAAGSLIGRQVGIAPKRFDDWVVIPNLWGMIVSKPSTKKSPAIAEILTVIQTIGMALGADFNNRMDAYSKQKKAYDIAERNVLSQLDNATKANNQSDMQKWTTQLHSLASPVPPAQKVLYVNDTTVEKLQELLRDNPNGMMVYRDELTGLFATFEKPGHESDRSFMLEGWDGKSPYTVFRIAQGRSLTIPACCLSLFGSIQPGPLSTTIKASVANGKGNDGLMQRFSLTVYPDMPTVWENVDRKPDLDAQRIGHNVMKKLTEIGGHTSGLEVIKGVPCIRFDSAAQALFDAWHYQLENEVRRGVDSSILSAHKSKYTKLVPGLALIFYLIDVVAHDLWNGGASNIEITLVHVARAVAWSEYLESHAYRVYATDTNTDHDSALSLLKHLADGDIDDGSPTWQITNKSWQGLGSTEQTKGALQVLEDFGWVKVERKAPAANGKGGRPSSVVRLHPDIATLPTLSNAARAVDRKKQYTDPKSSDHGFFERKETWTETFLAILAQQSSHVDPVDDQTNGDQPANDNLICDDGNINSSQDESVTESASYFSLLNIPPRPDRSDDDGIVEDDSTEYGDQYCRL